MAEIDETSTSLGVFNVSTTHFGALENAQAPVVADRRALLPEEQSAIDSLPYGSALLVVLAGPNEGSRYLINVDQTNVGRHPRADVFLDDKTVSRRHAQFLRQGNQFIVRDSGSLNGTYVNRERVTESVLHSGDEVQIGKFRLTFYPSQAEA